MASLTYFNVTATYLAALKDSLYDVDNDPELSPMSGTVVLTPLIDTGDSIPAPTLTPPANLWLVPIRAQIKGGKITTNGANGVKLVANTAVLGLSGNLYYRVDYPEGLTAGGNRYQPDPFTFQAPTTATTVDLVEVTPLPGHPAIADVLPVVSVGGKTGAIILTADDVSDAGATGKALTRAADQASAWSALGPVPDTNLPNLALVQYKGAKANQTAMLATTGEPGDWVTRTDTSTAWIITGSNPTQLSSWTQLPFPSVTWSNLSGMPVVVAAGTTQAEARDTIAATQAWKGSTAYTAGATISTPLGIFMARKTSGTSASTWATDQTNWVPSDSVRGWSVKDFGALGDGQIRTGMSMTSGSAVLTSDVDRFSAVHVGMTIGVTGAGSAGVPLITTISGFTDTKHVTLAAPAGATVASATASWGTDDSAAFTAAITAASSSRLPLTVPSVGGHYVADGLVIPNGSVFTMRGGSPASDKFSQLRGDATNNSHLTGAAATIRQVPGSSGTLLTVSGGGTTLEGFQLSGNNRMGAGVGLRIDYGMECRLNNIVVSDFAGVGLKVESANNAYWQSVFVFNCGANDGAGNSTASAVVLSVGSDVNDSVNCLTLEELNIEYSQGISLDIGPGIQAGGYYPEFLRIHKLHIEATTGYGGGITNPWPLVRLVNCRSVSFVDPFLYGGPGPCISHEFTATSSSEMGGITIIGGTLLGRRADSGAQPSTLVRLKTGDQFTMIGTRVDNYSTQAVLIDSTYNTQVFVHDIMRGPNTVSPIVTDNRTTRAPTLESGDYRVNGGVGLGMAPDAAYGLSSARTMQVVSGAGNVGYETTTYSFNGQSLFKRANGTPTGPSAVGNGDTIGLFGFNGHNGTAFAGTKAAVYAATTQAWTGGANGVALKFRTTPNNSSTPRDVAAFGQDGRLELPITGSGAGLLIGGDTTLYRDAADVLKTDDSFTIAGTLTSTLSEVPAYATTGQRVFKRANGTAGSPSALANTDVIGLLGFNGHNGSSFAGNKASIFATATQAWTGSNNGVSLTVRTTPNNSSTPRDVAIFGQDASLSVIGRLNTATPAVGGAGLNLPHGAAPTAPADGDMWTTTAGLFVRVNGVTKTVTLT